MADLDGITLVPEPSEEYLNERRLFDYRSRREDCLEWLLVFGKQPEEADGYAFQTVKYRAYRMDQFYRWVWEQENNDPTSVTHAPCCIRTLYSARDSYQFDCIERVSFTPIRVLADPSNHRRHAFRSRS